MRRFLARVLSIFRRERADREMSREIEAHLALMEDDLSARGMTPAEARLAARRAWGGVEQTKESHRDARSFIRIEQLLQDLRHAWRGLGRTPGFAIAAICTLALGIGGNTTIFSVLNAVFLRALPYAGADRIASVSVYSSGREGATVNMPDYVSWKAQNRSFERLSACVSRRGENVSAANHPAERVQVGLVTPDFFGMLSVQPRIGRDFRPEEGETGRNRVAIIAHSLWKDFFNAGSNALGAELMVGGIAYTIIGVAPAGFIYPDGEGRDDVAVWLPDAVDKKRSAPGNFWAGVLVIGRLKPGISMEQARADLELITRRMDDRFPNRASHAKLSVRVAPLQQRLTKASRSAIYILMGAAGCILLIVCANVANLFLARSAAREREIAVRASIGASRFRVVRLLIAESLLLGAGGGLLGIALAYLSAPALRFLLPAGVPPSVSIDWRVLAFAAACSIGAGLLFGLAPALVLSKLELTTSLKQAGAHPSRHGGVPRFRGALTIAQLALSVMLLIGAGLLIRTFVNVLRVNPGFDPRHVLVASFQLQPTKASNPNRQMTVYVPDVQRAFFDRALTAVQALPGVETAALISQPPIGASVIYPQRMRAEGEPGPEEPIYVTSASAGYFRALRIPLLQGRLFSPSDSAGAESVAIASETAARMLFGSRNPLGRVVLVREEALRIIGVASDARHDGLDGPVRPQLFRPYLQWPIPDMTILVRSYGEPEALVPSLRGVVHSLDPDQPVFGMAALETLLSDSAAERRQRALLLGAFAFVSLAIAAIGVYGIIAYSVERRRHEIGIRIALGARRGDILVMVLREGILLASLGVTIGFALAFALTRILAGFLFGVGPRDIATFASAGGALAAAALFASCVPAMRAMSVDPIRALRQE